MTSSAPPASPAFFTEAYVPVRLDGRAIAIVEVYVDQTEKRRLFHATFLAAAFASSAGPLLKGYCARCHNAARREGGVDLASITGAAGARRSLWKRAARRLHHFGDARRQSGSDLLRLRRIVPVVDG